MSGKAIKCKNVRKHFCSNEPILRDFIDRLFVLLTVSSHAANECQNIIVQCSNEPIQDASDNEMISSNKMLPLKQVPVCVCLVGGGGGGNLMFDLETFTLRHEDKLLNITYGQCK